MVKEKKKNPNKISNISFMPWVDQETNTKSSQNLLKHRETGYQRNRILFTLIARCGNKGEKTRTFKFLCSSTVYIISARLEEKTNPTSRILLSHENWWLNNWINQALFKWLEMQQDTGSRWHGTISALLDYR